MCFCQKGSWVTTWHADIDFVIDGGMEEIGGERGGEHLSSYETQTSQVIFFLLCACVRPEKIGSESTNQHIFFYPVFFPACTHTDAGYQAFPHSTQHPDVMIGGGGERPVGTRGLLSYGGPKPSYFGKETSTSKIFQQQSS